MFQLESGVYFLDQATVANEEEGLIFKLWLPELPFD